MTTKTTFDGINYTSIIEAIDAEISALHARTPRAKTRRIEQNNDYYASVVARMFRNVLPDDATVVLSHTGGFVPNSYGYRAEADLLKVTVDLQTGAVEVSATRAWAQSRARGVGAECSARFRTEGQSQGRYLAL
jgi:hypothetical protein